MNKKENATWSVIAIIVGLVLVLIALASMMGAVGALLAGFAFVGFGLWLMNKKPFSDT